MKLLSLGALAAAVFVFSRKRTSVPPDSREPDSPVVSGLLNLQAMMNRLRDKPAPDGTLYYVWDEVSVTGRLDEQTKNAYTQMAHLFWEWRQHIPPSPRVVTLDTILQWGPFHAPQQRPPLPPSTFFADSRRIRRLTDALGRMYYADSP